MTKTSTIRSALVVLAFLAASCGSDAATLATAADTDAATEVTATPTETPAAIATATATATEALADETAKGAPAVAGNDGSADARRGGPDFTEAAATLGVSVTDLEAALGRPPFDLDAAAATLGVSVTDLEAALPAPPGVGRPPAGVAPAGGTAVGSDTDTSTDEYAERASVITNARWASTVQITIEGGVARFASDGLPAHEYLDTYLADGRDGKYIAGGVDAYNASFTFPVVPTLAPAPAETGNGAIGVAISGAVFFDSYEGDGSTVANDDNSTIDGIPFIDACRGHPLPNASTYHYHGIPFCIVDSVDTPGRHSVLIGYLLDGHPIYGPNDVDGDEPTDLDACLGHVGPTPEFEGDTYHYHVVSTANYISECLAGVS